MFFRYFFRTLRIILGPFMLLWEKITMPRGIKRLESEQQRVDRETASLVIYQFRTCPFCIKVRRAIAELSLKIELRDAQKNAQHRAELQQGGGQIKVPCLKITAADGTASWMYESDEIISYLQQRFA